MTAPVIIRTALSTDLPSLVDLLALLFAIESDFTINPDAQMAGLELLLSKPQHCCLLVAETNGQVIGMCSAQLLISTAAGGLKALMEDLVISPEFRRQGIGTKLLVALEAWAFAQGAQRLDLLADQRNQPALDYYQKNQWQLTNLICFQKKSY